MTESRTFEKNEWKSKHETNCVIGLQLVLCGGRSSVISDNFVFYFIQAKLSLKLTLNWHALDIPVYRPETVSATLSNIYICILSFFWWCSPFQSCLQEQQWDSWRGCDVTDERSTTAGVGSEQQQDYATQCDTASTQRPHWAVSQANSHSPLPVATTRYQS